MSKYLNVKQLEKHRILQCRLCYKFNCQRTS